MFALETDLPRDPLWLAERVWGEPGACLLWTAQGEGPSYIACWPSQTAEGLDPEPALPWASSLLDWRASVPRWVGVLPYESERARLERHHLAASDRRERPHHERPRWWRYPAVAVVGRRVVIVGDDAHSAGQLLARLRGAGAAHRHGRLTTGRVSARRLSRDAHAEDAAHRQRIRQALEWIRDGEFYQVNLALRLDFEIEGTALSLLHALAQRAPAAFSAALEDAGVVSTSPELFLRTDTNRRAVTIPIKGTRPRGADAREDQRLLDDLARDPKEQAELSMVIDVERNDLGRVAPFGGVAACPPRIHRHATLYHRASWVSARIREGVSRDQLLQAMLPSGSVTGAPKVRAMEAIAQLEEHRRGLYTGAFGYLTHAGTLQLGMAIRTLTLREGTGHYFVGGGIVLDSDPDREVEETRWKSVQITGLLET